MNPIGRRPSFATGALAALAALNIDIDARNTQDRLEAEWNALTQGQREAIKRDHHLRTVAKRTHPKPSGRGRMWRQAGMGGIKARIAFWQGTKATNWHEALGSV